jgi:hypothetical protein
MGLLDLLRPTQGYRTSSSTMQPWQQAGLPSDPTLTLPGNPHQPGSPEHAMWEQDNANNIRTSAILGSLRQQAPSPAPQTGLAPTMNPVAGIVNPINQALQGGGR